MNPRRCTNFRWTWKEAVRDPQLGPQRTARSSRATVVSVAAAICDHMNASGWCFAPLGLLAGETGLSERSISDAVAALEARGWLSVRRGGRGHANEYRATLPEPVSQLVDDLLAPARKVDGPGPERWTVSAGKVDGASGKVDGPPTQVVPLVDPQDARAPLAQVVSLAAFRSRRSQQPQPPAHGGAAALAAVPQTPEWVSVWWWARANGEERVFPQEASRAAKLSEAEYLAIRERWRDAGAPRVCSPLQIGKGIAVSEDAHVRT